MRNARSVGMRVMVVGLVAVSAGCATRGQLERGLAEQRQALAAERAERLGAQAQLQSDLQQVAGRVENLRTDLAAMDQEFGAKLTQLEEGLQLAVPVHFAFDRSDVRDEATAVLDRFAAIIQRNYPDAMITVEGFTDPSGPATYNRQLAQRRAEAVRRELIARGLLPTQLRAVGYGAERQVVPGAAGQAFGAELNRRVVFVIETGTATVLGAPTAAR